MHYVNVITNSGNLKQPGRDTILIDYYCYGTITAGVILMLIRPRRFAPHSLLCFVSFVRLFLICYKILHWQITFVTLYALARVQIRFRLSLFH